MSQQAWFVFDKHQLEFETLDSKIAKGIVEIFSGWIQEKDHCLRGDPVQKRMSNVYRQANQESDLFVLQHR